MTDYPPDIHRKALIRLGSLCNNRCLFCHMSADNRPVLTTAEAKAKIRLAAELGIDMVVFSGGEPTIRKDFFELCSYVRGCGLDTGMISNGRMLFYQQFADELLAQGLKYVLLSLHGHDAKTHDSLTGAQGFKQVLAGLRRIAGHIPHLVVNTVLTRLNAGSLSRIAERLAPLGPLHFKVSLPEPKGAILSNPQLVLRPDKAAAVIAGLLDSYADNNVVAIGVDGLTPCLLRDFFHRNDDFFTHGFSLVSEPGESEFFLPDRGERAFGPACVKCSYYHLCPGIYRKYFDLFPGMILKPVCQPVSNELRFDRISREILERPSDICKVAHAPGRDPYRHLVYKQGLQAQIYRTDEICTTVPEGLRIKFDIEQVYSDKEGSARPLKLSLAAKCRSCAKLRNCPGVFVRSPRQPGAGLMKQMGRLLGMLRGRVLDAGCGQGWYLDTLREAAAAGRIREYVGVDPKPPAADREQGNGVFRFSQSTLEDFKWSGKPFDWIILFRSYHHLKDPDRALGVLSSMTRPGSRIIVTEDCRHIKLYDAGLKRADPGQVGFEHYRNHMAEDAVFLLNDHGFKIVETHDVARDSASHWTVIARRD